MQSCEPGDRACENHRRYYQTNFDRPNPYHDTPSTSGDLRSTATAGQERKSNDITPHSGSFRIAQPLKPSIRDLSQEQMNKAKMVKA